jgi:hypothetical protein
MIFLSYAQEDKIIVEQMVASLENQGIHVWLDKEMLSPGDKWEDRISEAIKSSRYFMPILSKASVEKVGYVQVEIRKALRAMEKYPANEIYIIPVRIEKCTPSFPEFEAIHYIDLFPDFNFSMTQLIYSILCLKYNLKRKESNNSTLNPNKLGELFINYGGLYRSKTMSNNEVFYWEYLRFYEEGIVIAASSMSPHENLVEPFSKEIAMKSKKFPLSIFKITGNQIKFTLTRPECTVNYEGTASQDIILLKKFSKTNNISEVQTYELVQNL